MPKVITSQDALEKVVKELDLTAELFEEQAGRLKYGPDLEVIIRGRVMDNGKKVGPYARVLSYEPGEEIVRQGEWGGNIFYISATGSLDVYVADANGSRRMIGELPPGTCFGEMSVLAGIERNATVAVPAGDAATVLELTRPSLRLLRKLPKFGQALDSTYRSHGLKRVLEDLTRAIPAPTNQEIVNRLEQIGKFMVYGKPHLLCEEGKPADKIILIKSGWVRRIRGIRFNAAEKGIAVGVGKSIGADFLGAGNCLGLESIAAGSNWKYTASVMARTEVLEVPIESLSSDPALCDQVILAFSSFSNADDKLPPTIEEVADPRVLAATEEEISTGIVDSVNLLVMDMDLCVRCGNCSLACHKVHGQSRLLRRGINIERPIGIGHNKTTHVLSPSVCMHCKDPECLTGCPTGAIFRDLKGDVDINPATCIGCFDCATQCPYNAISMVPRNLPPPARTAPLTRIKNIFSLKASAPAAITEADDMIAIKCNLCENTPLNPDGAKRPAYSCEENCPTGALVRVNPHEYFDEVGKTLGLVFRDQTHAIGRNIHKSDPIARIWHVGGIVSTIAIGSVLVWAAWRFGMNESLRGTWLTMRWITGLVGFAGVAGVMTYPARKTIYRKRVGALRYWLLAHIYLGVFAAIALLIHGASHGGGLLTLTLMLWFDATILTGVFGVLCYVVVPRIMTSIEGDPLLIEDLESRRC